MAIDLAEIAVAFAGTIEDRVVRRIREEIERKVFVPYLANYESYPWYGGRNNWNGVCNGAIGAAFLLLEQDTVRLSNALSIVLDSLQTFLDIAFEEDGTSSEGVGYWQYGMSNLICFAELLRHRTRGAIDILSTPRVAEIAHYPSRVMLSPGHYFAFSDCNEITRFNPGLIARLAQRTGVEALPGLLAAPAPLDYTTHRFHTAWRGVLWWDGRRPEAPVLEDDDLPSGGVTRLVGGTPSGAPVVLAAKAGHNGVSHNHNDVGTFVLHVEGETLLCDPERGLYDLYRKHGQDANVFANSYGHSVPVIGGALQSRGAAFGGEVTAFAPDGAPKRVEMSLAGAYQVASLEEAARTLTLDDKGTLVVEDRFSFSGDPQPVQEALVTWLKPFVSGGTAYLVGERHILQLQIEAPEGALFGVEVLDEASRDNHKPAPLVRLTFEVPAAPQTTARVRATVLPQ
jgi:hypothetical protein